MSFVLREQAVKYVTAKLKQVGRKLTRNGVRDDAMHLNYFIHIVAQNWLDQNAPFDWNAYTIQKEQEDNVEYRDANGKSVFIV